MIGIGSIRQKLYGLTVTMALAVMIVSGISGYILYQTYLTQTAERLRETARSNSRLIDAFAQFENNHASEYHTATPGYQLTLSLIKQAHEEVQFGQSGEFTLAKQEGEQIKFLMRNRLSGMDIPDPVPLSKLDRAEPMRQALAGASGWMIGRDYRGVQVMAAYEPVPMLGFGIVAKIDMQEIRAPFIHAGIVMLGFAVLISFAAFAVYYWVSKQIFNEFEDSTQRFNRIARSANDVIFRMSLPDGRYEYINPAARKIFGVSADECYASPQKIRQMIHPDWEEYISTQWSLLLKGQPLALIEYRIINALGETLWLQQSNVLITDFKGKPIALEGIIKDITAHMEYTQNLQREKEIAQTYFDIAGTMMMVIDPQGYINLINQKACEVIGWEEQDVLGKNWFDHFIPEAVRDEVKLTFNKVVCGNIELVEFYENRILTQSGEERIVAWHNRILWSQDQQSVTGILCSGEDITQQRIQEEKIIQQAHFDNLTRLPNRFLTLDRLSHLINEAKRNNEHIAILFIDLDDFKKANDTHGHETGDQLLIDAAERFLHDIRAGDTVGRLGGDEFLLLLGGIKSPLDAQSIASNLIERFNQPFSINGHELLITLSIGIAIYPDDGNNASELLRNADMAMYSSKKEGRNTYSFFTHSMNSHISRRIQLEEQMIFALEKNEFYVVYQPQYEINSKNIIGAEALLRWKNPLLGQVEPDEFIPVAEQTGLILQLEQYVFKQALGSCKKWLHYNSQFRIFVNLSPRQFREPALAENFQQLLDQHQIKAKHLGLEITERTLSYEQEHLVKTVSALSDKGISFAMDDFGTGYSSINYLRNYPFNTVKIDRSYIQSIATSPAEREMIDAIIAMSHGLGLEVIAEGVETQQQLDYLIAMNCDYVQGFLFSEPIPQREFTEMLKHETNTKSSTI